jgi:hypothetical protein
MTFEEYAGWRLPSVSRFAAVLTGARGLAEDVVQEVMIRAHGRWGKISRLDHPDRCVRRMVVNELISARRRSWRLVQSGHAEDVDDRVAPDHASDHAERGALLAELGKTPPGGAPSLCSATTRDSPMPRSPRCSAASLAPSADMSRGLSRTGMTRCLARSS